MKVQRSERADALYIEFDDRDVAYSENLSRGGQYDRGVDYAADDTPVGVEFLNVSRGIDLADVPRAEEIARAVRAAGITVSNGPLGRRMRQPASAAEGGASDGHG